MKGEAMSPLNIKQGASSHSAYDLRDPHAEVIESHTLGGDRRQ
jgi:acetolactate synthase I/III small subunit